MNLRIPVPRPVDREDETATSARGGVDSDDLRRIERRAERFLSEQAHVVDDALRLKLQQEDAALARQIEAQEARAILARADTMKAEANTRLAIYLAVGTIGAAVLGTVLFGTSNAWRLSNDP